MKAMILTVLLMAFFSVTTAKQTQSSRQVVCFVMMENTSILTDIHASACDSYWKSITPSTVAFKLELEAGNLTMTMNFTENGICQSLFQKQDCIVNKTQVTLLHFDVRGKPSPKQLVVRKVMKSEIQVAPIALTGDFEFVVNGYDCDTQTNGYQQLKCSLKLKSPRNPVLMVGEEKWNFDQDVFNVSITVWGQESGLVKNKTANWDVSWPLFTDINERPSYGRMAGSRSHRGHDIGIWVLAGVLSLVLFALIITLIVVGKKVKRGNKPVPPVEELD